MPCHYKAISSCVAYQSYQFDFPLKFHLHAYEKLRAFILGLADNHYPTHLQVLQLQHPDFILDFPAYGFPYFKIRFYRHVSLKMQKNYLRLLNVRLESCITP